MCVCVCVCVAVCGGVIINLKFSSILIYFYVRFSFKSCMMQNACSNSFIFDLRSTNKISFFAPINIVPT